MRYPCRGIWERRKRFYWPSLHRDVTEWCRVCEQCQKGAPGKNVRAPLMPLPVIEEPFSRIAMDVIGPLPRSNSNNEYILVICDYATRYPEAIPMRSVDAKELQRNLLVCSLEWAYLAKFSQTKVPTLCRSYLGSFTGYYMCIQSRRVPTTHKLTDWWSDSMAR